MVMPETIVCNLCGSDSTTPLFETRDCLLNLPGNYRFVRCRVCGLIYVNPQPTWAERAGHYASVYRGYHRLETEPSPLQRRSMEYGLHKRCRIVASHLRGGRLLDAGCGGGDFLYWTHQRQGWRVYGLERVSEMALVARRRYSLRVAVGDLIQPGFASGSFDVVTLWTVLEHLPDPAHGLSECARILRPGGLLVVRTVTVDSWGARLFGPYWLGYDAPRILFVFSRRTLRQMLSKTGFEVLDMDCHFHDFHPFLWSWRNLCEARVSSLSLCRFADNVARSWPVRLLSFPFFAVQTLLGRNSLVTAVACKS
jgi:2-polyprenyl-3-methyl-5-hydroxy-6-metoxy-1,4-benzoquinol methylase